MDSLVQRQFRSRAVLGSGLESGGFVVGSIMRLMEVVTMSGGSIFEEKGFPVYMTQFEDCGMRGDEG
jgi:hypothetical protein